MAVNTKKYHSDPFLCNCGPCKRFWRSTFFNSSDNLTLLSEQRAESLCPYGSPKPVAVGDRVKTSGKPGVVKFLGFVDEDAVPPTLRIGIKLDESVLMGHDGVYKGKRYFNCTDGHGVFVKYTEITQLQPPNKRPPVQGNTMFPSWPDICKRRKQREKMLEEMRKETQKTVTPGAPVKMPPPPIIHPRETKTQQLRRRIKPYWFTHDTFDMIIKDQELLQQKKEHIQDPASSQIKWEDKQIRQWRQKYADPEKVKRMGETLKKLSSAYQEGLKLRDSITPELE